MVNDNDDTIQPTVYVLVGRVWEGEDGQPDDSIPVHILLRAADDDDAVRKTLNALSEQGFAEAELDQIGVMDGEPDEDIYEAAYADALAGNVSVIRFG
ncbi:regulator [Roseibium sp. CAU 1637]|uniref:Regulator n=1 Tax=Roseibium limicola TaxID=2816037 RepID=A0A939EPQ5_9HYPH|nr:regulator [Roseibium limicola]MBO0344839.1 regulator [Roseibium limicola]